MRRALRLIVPAVILVEVVLVWSGVIDLGDALLVVIGIEAMFFLVIIFVIVLAVRRLRREHSAGSSPWKTLEQGLCLVLPRTAVRWAMLEPMLFAALIQWASRRAKPTENEFSYHKRSVLRALVPLVVMVSPLELLIIHLLAVALIPWSWVKWVLLFLGIWAIFWVLGLYASLATHPHRMEETGLRLRYGLFAEGFIPYVEIGDTARASREAPRFGEGLSHIPEEDAFYLVAGGKTDLTLRLKNPRSVRGFFSESTPASLFHLSIDDPESFLLEVRKRMREANSAVSGVASPGEIHSS